MMAGAARKSAIVSNSGTIGRVQASTPASSRKRPCFLGEEIGAENIGGRAGHAEDETAKSFPVELLALVAGELEHAKRLQRLGRQASPRTRRR